MIGFKFENYLKKINTVTSFDVQIKKEIYIWTSLYIQVQNKMYMQLFMYFWYSFPLESVLP